MGATELFLREHLPASEQIPAGEVAEKFWRGKWLLLRTDPQDPSMPARRHFVRVKKVEHTTDPLFLDTANNPIAITRIQWEEAQALPFEMCLLDLSVHGNIVPATAGETMTEFFVIGRNQAIVAAPKIRDDQGNEAEVHTAVERQTAQ